jgi:copper homeostasis protein
MLLEIACFNLESALIAQRAGADRIELCEDYSCGGVTPSFETIIEARKKISIPLFVMIHPRKGTYTYNQAELEEMIRQIRFCKEHAIDGVVFGALDEDKNIDKILCAALSSIAHPLKTTFHRAFDEVENPFDALEDVIDCRFDRILTSGSKKTAIEGSHVISGLIKKAGSQITILPGGGIRSNNIAELKKETGAVEFHSAALNTSTMLADENGIKRMKALLAE